VIKHSGRRGIWTVPTALAEIIGHHVPDLTENHGRLSVIVFEALESGIINDDAFVGENH